MFLDEYGTALFDYGAKISIKKVVFRDFSDHNLGYQNLIAPLDRARRVVLVTHFGTLGTGS